MSISAILLIAAGAALSNAAPVVEATPDEPEAVLATEAAYTVEGWRNVHGGVRTGSELVSLLELSARLDSAAIGVRGWELYASAFFANGGAFGEAFAGSVQGVSGIEAERGHRPGELHLQWQSQNAAVLAGFYDVNSEFDAIEGSALFLQPSHAMGPPFALSGANGPSTYPVTGLGVRGQIKRGAWLLRAAAIDGFPGAEDDPQQPSFEIDADEGALLLSELNYSTETGARAALGYWTYTAPFAPYASDTTDQVGRTHGNDGGYVLLESAPRDWLGARVHGYARLARADERFNVIENFVGAGLVSARNFVHGDHQWGVAFAWAKLSDASRMAAEATLPDHETIFELSYRVQFLNGLVVQPDVQYVLQPAAFSGLDDAWILGLRLEWRLNR